MIPFTPVQYVRNVTHITADNLNDIQAVIVDNMQQIDANATEITDLNNALDDIGESTVIQGTNLFDGNFDESGYFTANGNQSSPTYKRTSKYYEIPENATKIYAYLSSQTAAFAIGFYDSTKTWKAAKNVNNTTTKENDIPSNSKYFRVYTRTDWNGNCTLATSYVNSYIPYVEPTNKFVLNGAFKGKTIAFFGDSIIGNFNDYSGICSILAEITDATIINCAFGGTRMAYEYSAYGDATPGASGYIDGATDAEKNQVDQFRYWNTLSCVGLSNAIASGDWTAQDAAIANLNQGLSYFADRLTEIKTIDWSTIDYILWEYGTNDFSTGVMVSDTTDITNLFAYDNAYRKAIEQISTAYPNIQLIPVTPIWRWWRNGDTTNYLDDSNTHVMEDYEGTPRLLTAFVAKAQEIAMEYQLPCIDDYYSMGANKFTYLHFYNNTDGAHPSAEGRKRIAKHIASCLTQN